MAELVIAPEQKQEFSPYSKEIDEYFLKNPVVIKTFPNNLDSVREEEFPDFQITSAQQYFEYLEQETNYWKENDPRRKATTFSQIDHLDSALNYFNQAVNHNSIQYLSVSVNQLSSASLYSKTQLAQLLTTHLSQPNAFFSGLHLALNDQSTSLPSDKVGMEGFLVGMAYRKVFPYYIECAEDHISTFKENIEVATQNYSKLNEDYTTAFHQQEERIAAITQQTNEHLQELDQKSEQQMIDANSRLQRMEDLYREKLRLEAPADYWKKLKKDYSKRGFAWLSVSVALAVAIITVLIITLLNGLHIFSDDVHWLDNLKNSAIITVITSIAIYILRLTVKMTLSSFHLSSDAKERENLSHFYLALIEKGAVTDKERAIILNALFSRSDTGLLKGDSAPTMPNVSDFAEIFKNK